MALQTVSLVSSFILLINSAETWFPASREGCNVYSLMSVYTDQHYRCTNFPPPYMRYFMIKVLKSTLPKQHYLSSQVKHMHVWRISS